MKKSLICWLLCTVFFCIPAAASASAYDPISLTDQERAAANLFLSNFTETGVKAIESWSPDQDLVDFAHDHLWFNDHDSFEYGEYGADNNCRVPDDRIQEIIDRYFYDSYQADLRQTRFDYDGEYYFHCETGGWINAGFAHAVSAVQTEEDTYFISFLIFGGGCDWDNSVMDDPLGHIEKAFYYPCGYGSALIHAEDLSDRTTYRMISYSRL